MDGQTLGMLTVAGLAIVAPVAAAVTSMWPSRATRWAARLCLTLVAIAVLSVAGAWWEHLSREPPEADSEGFVEHGDDSGVMFVTSAAVLLVALLNLGGWGVANARAPARPDRHRT